jgi:hypothetical protein
MQGDAGSGAPAGSAQVRVLVLPPTHADGVAIARLLHSVGIHCAVVSDVPELCDALGVGAGSIIISEEAVLANSLQLLGCLAHQPVWSELPLIVLSKPGREPTALAEFLPHLRGARRGRTRWQDEGRISGDAQP